MPGTQQFLDLLQAVIASPAINLHGFYAHAGTSYASKSLEEASGYLTAEISAVLDASQVARTYLKTSSQSAPLSPFVLSVGSTPTAHAFSKEAFEALQSRLDEAGAELELHAGNYPMLDLQQVATSLVPLEAVSQRVLASVISYYPGRGEGGIDEAMCDAGGLAMTRDTGPIPGFGDVVRISHPQSQSDSGSAGDSTSEKKLGTDETGWRIGRMSQEHGILTRKSGGQDSTTAILGSQSLRVGDLIEIVGQHACVIAAAYPWFYIVDSSNPGGANCVADIWVPCKGW